MLDIPTVQTRPGGKRFGFEMKVFNAKDIHWYFSAGGPLTTFCSLNVALKYFTMLFRQIDAMGSYVPLCWSAL